MRHRVETCIIILNYNTYSTTIKCVENILDYDSIDKIIVVDNKSTDDSYQKFVERFSNIDKIDILQTDRNGGYAYGNNFGIKYAVKEYCPKYFFISNPDVSVSERTIKGIVDFYKCYSNTEKIGIISALAITKGGRAFVAGKLPSFKDDIILSIGLLYKFFGDPTEYDKEYLFSKEYAKVDVLPGSFFFISSEALQNINYFDENTFLYGEERILSYKLIKQGYENYLLTNFSYYHNHGDSINKSISSHLEQYILIQKSRKYYHACYLKSPRLKLFLFDLVTYVGIMEKSIYFPLKNFKNKVIKFVYFSAKWLIKQGILALNFIIPKDPNSFIFMSFPDFSGNAKTMYEYLLHISPDYKLVWLVYERTSLKQLLRYGVKCYYIRSIKGLMTWLRSRFIISSTGILSTKSCRQIGINLWHGMPLKAMGFIDKSTKKSELKKIKSWHKKADLLISTSTIMKNALSTCFNINPRKIIITGQPRNDKLFSPHAKDLLASLLNVDITHYRKIILFVPTFRGRSLREVEKRKIKDNNFLQLKDFDSETFERFLLNNNILFLLKFHPFEEDTIESKKMSLPQNVILIRSHNFIRKFLDLYDILEGIDILITDYSSIYFDFLLLNRPILFIPIDLEEYRKKRGFALEPYEFWTPGPKITSFKRFIIELEKCIDDPGYYEKEREIINNLVNKYKDGRSSERVYKIICSYRSRKQEGAG